MELRQLRYFVAAAETQNFRRAAECVHVVQPALSRQIAMLEQELGLVLFERVKRRVKLTPAGQAYLTDIRLVLREIELAGERASRVAHGTAGVLRIGFHETAGRSRLVSDAFRDFRRACPDIELKLVQMASPAQIDAMSRGELDAGFVYLQSGLPTGLASRAVETHRAYLALPTGQPLAARVELRIEDLRGEPFIGIGRAVNPLYYDALAVACRKAGLVPDVVQETQSEATTMNLVAVGLGVALVVSATPESWTPGVVIRPVRGLDFALTLALVWRSTDGAASSQSVERFEALLKAQ